MTMTRRLAALGLGLALAAAAGGASIAAGLAVSSQPNTVGGWAWKTAASLTTAQQIKLGQGQIAMLDCDNANAATVFIQFYDASTSPTLGTNVLGFAAIPVNGGGFSLADAGGQFAAGLYVAATTTALGSTTATTALNCTVLYK